MTMGTETALPTTGALYTRTISTTEEAGRLEELVHEALRRTAARGDAVVGWVLTATLLCHSPDGRSSGPAIPPGAGLVTTVRRLGDAYPAGEVAASLIDAEDAAAFLMRTGWCRNGKEGDRCS